MKFLSSAAVTLLLLFEISCIRSARYYADQGNHLSSIGKDDDAALNYRKAIQKDPSNGAAHLGLGKIELRQHHILAAFESFVRAAQLLPQSDEAKILLGDLAVSLLVLDKNHPKNLYDQVSRLTEQVSAKNPNSFDALRWKGYLAFVDRKPSDAIGYFSKALQMKPGDPDLAAMLVQCLLQGGQKQDAEKLALEQIATGKTNAELYDVLYWHYRSEKRNADAEAILRKKIAKLPENYLQLPVHYYETQNPAAMKRVLAEYAKNKREHPVGLLEVGDFYMKLGMAPEAIGFYQDCTNTIPKAAKTCSKRLADAYMRAGRNKDAQLIVDQLYQREPKDIDVRGVRASLLTQSGNTADRERAIVEFNALLNDRPKDPVLRFGLGQALLMKGELDEARKQFQAALEFQPGFVTARYELAEIAVAQGNAAELLRQGRELARLQPSSARANRLLGMGLALTGATDAARVTFQRLLRSDPADLETRIQLALLETRSKHFQDAEALLRTGPSGGASDPRLLPVLAQLRLAQNEPKRAMTLLTDALLKQPGNGQIHLLLARVAYINGELDIAIEQYKYLLSQQKSAELYYELARAQEQKGDANAALASFQEIHLLAPRDARAEFGMGRVYDSMGRAADAISHYQSAVQLGYDDPQLMISLALALAESGKDLDRASELARKTQVKFPNAPAVADTLGYTYLKKNMTDSAMAVFSGLVQKYPSTATYRYHLALAMLQKGNTDSARRELRECLKQRQPEPQATKITALLASLK